MPKICIYDVKHIKARGIDYDHDLMFKVVNSNQSGKKYRKHQ